ncbi:MAG: universal stress protein [Actinomycetota bacterium]|nr:universal stress protein [Actinomycetota bacterium]
MDRIVVGVDGSDGARKALETAIDVAAGLGAQVEAICVWSIVYGAGEFAMTLPMAHSEFEEASRKALNDLVTSMDTKGVVVQQSIIEGDAASVLIRASEGARMLVVGSRGHGGFVGLLVGSVSHKVIAHAHCPVLVVPMDDA